MRFPWSLLPLACLAGCPDGAPASPDVAPVASVTTRVVAGYDAVRPGQVYAYRVLGGERRDTIVSVGRDELLIRRRLEVAGAASDREVREAVPPPDEPVPEGAVRRPAGGETLVVSGRELRCKLRELVIGGEVLVREWIVPDYPFVAKRVGNGFVVHELIGIEEGR